MPVILNTRTNNPKVLLKKNNLASFASVLLNCDWRYYFISVQVQFFIEITLTKLISFKFIYYLEFTRLEYTRIVLVLGIHSS